MKFLYLLLVSTLAVSQAALSTYGKKNYVTSSHGHEQDTQVLRNDLNMKEDGSYRYEYETSNGITGMEEGLGGVSVQGANSWVSPEGVVIKTTYVADESGYHPVGDHIPQVPDYILRALEYIRTHPPKDDNNYDAPRKSFPAPQRIAAKIAPPTTRAPPRRVTPAPTKYNAYKKSPGKSQYQSRSNNRLRKY